jgi:hypothetical protein
MKTSTELMDNATVSPKTIYGEARKARQSHDNKINELLSKYNSTWAGNESEVDMAAMTDTDAALYVSMCDSRNLIKRLERQLGMLL